MKQIILFFLLMSLFIGLTTSCFKEDSKIAPHPVDTTKVEMIPMTQYYSHQVYFDLTTGEQVAQNLKSDYDLMFSSSDTGYQIRLNTAKFMMAAATNALRFEDVTDTTGLTWRFDASSGNPDSVAFGDWLVLAGADTLFPQRVYIVDRGIDDLGRVLGLRKVIFHRLAADKYRFSYCKMDNSDQHEYLIGKEAGYNTVQFSFDTQAALQTEPLNTNWDLLFTQYTTMLITSEGENYPYLLTGVLINPNGVAVAFDSTMVFDNVVVDDVLYLDYSHRPDVIGYNWKELIGDINGGDFYYKCNPRFNYFIQTRSGVFYKLRFTSFYDPVSGEKGYPTFEYRRL